MCEKWEDVAIDMIIESALKKIAIEISENKCDDSACPCQKDCNVFTNEECVDRIIDWFKSVIEI